MTKKKTPIPAIVVYTLILICCPPTPGKIIYVDDDANGLDDGSSWVNAFDHLQDALALARMVQKPVEIRVGQGIYRPDRTVEQVGEKHGTYIFTFELVEGAVLRGGYAGVLAPDPNVRDVHKYRSTLSGDLGGDDVPTGFPRDLVDVDPCFAKVGYWADPNNVDVPVDPNSPNAVWIEGDYHLKSQTGRWDPTSGNWVTDEVTSPCIDAGDPRSAVGDEPQPNGERVNMGAYGGTAETGKSVLQVSP